MGCSALITQGRCVCFSGGEKERSKHLQTSDYSSKIGRKNASHCNSASARLHREGEHEV